MRDHGFDPIAALRADHGGLAAEAAVDLRVDGLREELIALGLEMEPPIDPAAVAAALGIEVHDVTADEAGFDAALLEDGAGRFRVLLNAGSGGPGRQRFTLAHEIVHTLVPSDPGRPRFRKPERRKRPDAALERLIDRGAARLLMPPERFDADLADAGLTPGGLMSVAEHYRVSREAAAVQAMARCPEPAAVLFCGFAYRPSTRETNPNFERKGWRVERGFASASFPRYPYPGLALVTGSVVERAAVAGRAVAGIEALAFRGRAPLRVRVAAGPLGRRVVPPPRVLAVVRVTD